MGPLIFVVDGISDRRGVTQQILEQAGYRVEVFATTRALEVAEQWLPSLMIIAIELPDGNGIVLREQIRRSSALAATPVVMLTDAKLSPYRDLASSSPHEYLIYPFGSGELLSMVETTLLGTRDRMLSAAVAADIVIDSAAMKVFVRGKEIRTTALEFRLIEYMARHQGKVFTRDALLDAVWGDLQFVTPRSVDACIRRIRRKIESDSNSPQFLRTIRGIGYKLDGQAAWEAADLCQCRMCAAVRSKSKTLSARIGQVTTPLARQATCN